MFTSSWDAGQAVYLAIVVGAIAAIVFYSVRTFRSQGRKPWPAFFVGAYNVALLLLFLFGMFTQESSEGFGFLPLMGLTLPWSWVLDWAFTRAGIADQNFLGGGPADTFLYIFLIHNVLATSANSFLLYVLLRRRQKKRAEDDAWEQARRNR